MTDYSHPNAGAFPAETPKPSPAPPETPADFPGSVVIEKAQLGGFVVTVGGDDNHRAALSSFEDLAAFLRNLFASHTNSVGPDPAASGGTGTGGSGAWTLPAARARGF